MNTEIKIRIWDDDNETMTIVGMNNLDELVECLDSFRNYFSHKYFERQPPMIFTGLLDKNGKEIYLGDILKDNIGTVGEVCYHTDRASFIFHDSNNYNVQLFEKLPFVEIIGNVKENPELIINQ